MDTVDFQSIISTNARNHIDSDILDMIGGPPLVSFKHGENVGRTFMNYTQANKQLTPAQIAKDEMCPCNRPEFQPLVHPEVGHVITKSLDWCLRPRVRKLFSLDTKFRLNACSPWFSESLAEYVEIKLREFAEQQHEKFGIPVTRFDEFIQLTKTAVDRREDELWNTPSPQIVSLTGRDRAYISWIRRKLVITATDKNASAFCFSCKQHYGERAQALVRSQAYEVLPPADVETRLDRCTDFTEKSGLVVYVREDDTRRGTKEPRAFSCLYLMGKIHRALPKHRHVFGRPMVPTTVISKGLSKALQLMMPILDQMFAGLFLHYTGIKTESCWILSDTQQFVDHERVIQSELQRKNSLLSGMTGLQTRDFSDMYPSVPQLSMIEVWNQLIDACFKLKETEESKTKILVPCYKQLDREYTRWLSEADAHKNWGNSIVVSNNDLKEWIRFVVENTACELGGEVFHLLVGIPIGTNAARELINGYLAFWEIGYTWRLCQKRRQISDSLGNELLTMLMAKRFVDDIRFVELRNHDLDSQLLDEREDGGSDGIYPCRLEGPHGTIEKPLKLELQDRGLKVPFLDTCSIFDPETRQLRWEHYDKRDHIPAFKETHTFPHPDSMLQQRSKLGTLTGAMHRFSRASTTRAGFVRKVVAQVKAMLRHGYSWQRVRLRLGTFSKYDRSRGDGEWRRVRLKILRAVRQIVASRDHSA